MSIRWDSQLHVMRTELSIDGYIREFDSQFPTDITAVIHEYLTIQCLFDCDIQDFKTIAEWTCIELSYKKAINRERLVLFVEAKQIHGRRFCHWGQNKWKVQLTKSEICNIATAVKMWEKIHRFIAHPARSPLCLSMADHE